ncbi:magnesium transporter MgtE N-terminal domain-containing protein [Lawsonella clevelandensis]|uniref:Magnesium transporter MgtE n=1 Tax=Lawsonella clevelandensis TaxID=1528099 RepID=A0A5E3ZVH8_9ACTN|nr:CBS domain-containing protein [Lawsonella clevelandensis]ALE34304.1 magnesium transporter [Lawsonella clevelandensis]MDU7193519.1 CBS domain-containing protein [Lawsonella clevelandensis]VHN99949.1 Magnesium transporter MgtE [Lawsonella clevelandensis]
MSSPNRVFVGRLDNLVVLGPDGESVGRVRDVVLTLQDPTSFPRAVGLVIQLLNRRRIFLPMLRVASFSGSAVTLVTGNVTVRSFKQQPTEIQVLGEMVDSLVQVRDPEIEELDGKQAVVTDVEIEQTRSRDWVVSRLAVRRRTGPFSRRGAVYLVEWEFIRGFSNASVLNNRQDATVLAHRYEDMRPADAASAILNLPQKRRLELATVLDDERLADIVQELPDDDQTDLLTALPLPRAADVLEAMDPDDAADVLGEMPDQEAERLLNLMNKQDAGTVRRLLTFSPDTAGGIMTPEPIILNAQTTVAEALAHVRNPELSPALSSLVYVVRPPTQTPTGKYLGVVHTQRLLREPPSTLIGDYVDTNLTALTPDASTEAVARYLATYNLVCGPVIDNTGHLLGAVSVDDLLDHLLPEDWREEEMAVREVNDGR